LNRPELIYDLDFEQLSARLASWGTPSYRAGQLWGGLYSELWHDPSAFTTLPTALRVQLADAFSFHALTEELSLHSKDGQTTKTLFRLDDGQAIETVLMRYDQRNTLCISTQAGCAMGCVFCATGQMGFRRNLSSGEIVEQVLFYARTLAQAGEKVTNVVFMGMGEPFHNYEASMAAIDRLNHPQGFNLSARRFTVSTVGLIPAIRRFTSEKRQVRLAISLHATDDAKRSAMLPVNQRYPIMDLIQACRDYVDHTGRRISFEWALIQDENDSIEQARSLADLLQGINCHVNVIPLNPTQGYRGKKSTRERVAAFQAELLAQGISCTVRVRRGIDIGAGCGQLAEKNPNSQAKVRQS
jgi:23S rRNA (adenine2503-C2)-methyltransferase